MALYLLIRPLFVREYRLLVYITHIRDKYIVGSIFFPYLRQAKYCNDFLINKVQFLLFFQSILKIPAIDSFCFFLTFVDITWELVINVGHHPPSYIYQMNLILIEILICILNIEKHCSKMYLKV